RPRTPSPRTRAAANRPDARARVNHRWCRPACDEIGGTMSEGDSAAAGVAHFQIVAQRDGRYHWQIVNPHGTPTARSTESYATEAEAVAAAQLARRLIAKAPIKPSIK